MFALLFFLISHCTLFCATFADLDLQDLLRHSPYVLRAECLGDSKTLKKGHVWTQSKWRVLEYFKGFGPRVVTTEYPGGRLEGYITRSGLQSVCREDRQTLLFLYDSKPVWQLTAFHRGAFEIFEDVDQNLKVKTALPGNPVLARTRMNANSDSSPPVLMKFLQNPNLETFRRWIEENR